MSVSGPKRIEILNRDRGKPCAICNDNDGPFEVDHINPKSNGGGSESDNLQKICRRCNRDKNNYVADEETGALVRPAVRPVVHTVQRTLFVGRTVEQTKQENEILKALIQAPPLLSDGHCVFFHTTTRNHGRGPHTPFHQLDGWSGGLTTAELLKYCRNVVEMGEVLKYLYLDEEKIFRVGCQDKKQRWPKAGLHEGDVWGLVADYYQEEGSCIYSGDIQRIRERLGATDRDLVLSKTRLWPAGFEPDEPRSWPTGEKSEYAEKQFAAAMKRNSHAN